MKQIAVGPTVLVLMEMLIELCTLDQVLSKDGSLPLSSRFAIRVLPPLAANL